MRGQDFSLKFGKGSSKRLVNSYLALEFFSDCFEICRQILMTLGPPRYEQEQMVVDAASKVLLVSVLNKLGANGNGVGLL